MTIDLASIGRELKKPVEQVESALRLLDDGNTIPFITRFRKDETGGLNEEQLLDIKQNVARLRSLAERKAFILKSIESQGKLNEALSTSIDKATSSRVLEDLYLPFKPKKQTLATVARQNGLEPLAMDIFEGREPEKDLAVRATDFVRVDKDLKTVDDVIAGVGHILAEKFSDSVELRNDLRGIINSKGRLTTKLIEANSPKSDGSDIPAKDVPSHSAANTNAAEETMSQQSLPKADASADQAAASDTATTSVVDRAESTSDSENVPDAKTTPETEGATTEQVESLTTSSGASTVDAEKSGPTESASDSEPGTETDAKTTPAESSMSEASTDTPPAKPGATKKPKKKKKKKKVDDPYKDYSDFSQLISKIPYHKTLAINRGEKNGRLKVKIQFEEEEFLKQACDQLVKPEHPFAEFLHTCVRDAMTRFVIPSLERETRREITEAAEKHAVQVFARNLKNLLLQAPVRNHRVLAIDPGYKRGCSVAVLDLGGQVLEHAHVFVVGNEQRRTDSRQRLVDLVKQHGVNLIAIGNGTACREAEQLVSDVISESFEGKELKYAIVNEAGASFYSTSEVGREELPDLSPAVRSAVSIGRRLIDPLSELVKISPANLGVGLYQHDVKAKHLSDSLDDVVQFCVNRVGVDVNTASPSLLKYVSGLNQLTARRVYEHRQEHGAFSNREQLKTVASFGDATFVQAAGFLRVHGGDQPLDSTGIHPESYTIAQMIFDRANATVEEVFPVAANSCSDAPAESDSNTESKSSNDASGASVEIKDGDESAEGRETSIEVDSEATAPAESAPSAAVVSSSVGSDGEAQEVTSVGATTETIVSEVATSVSTASETTAVADPTVSNESKPDAVPSEDKVAPAPIAKRPTLTPQQESRRRELVKAIRALDPGELATETETGQLKLRDILHWICKPEFDPRNKVNRPVFRSGIIKIDDLKVDMCLDAQVVNVVDFGVFVDIGLGTSCLVHVSQLANYFIRDPHRFFAVGDVLKVWVTEVDSAQRRVKLTAVQPASLRPKKRDKGGEAKSHRRPHGRKSFKHRDQKRSHKPRRSAPKPVKPITDDMLTGEEPMRSFSDLAQFFEKKPEDNAKKKNK